MLEAPTTVSNELSEATRTTAAPESQRELHPRYAGVDDSRADRPLSFAALSGVIQLRQHFAGLQKTVGNQTVLRFLDQLQHSPSAGSSSADSKPGNFNSVADRMSASSAVLAGSIDGGASLSTSGLVVQRSPVDGNSDPIHDPLIAQYRQAMGQPPGGIDPDTGQQVGPTDAELKYGGILNQWLATQNSSAGQTTNPVPQAPTTPSCSPSLQQPKLTIGPKPLLSPLGQGCNLRLFGSGLVLNGMEFKGQIQGVANCSGKVYFVQYAKLNRSSVGCGSKPAGFCTKRAWGLDTAWPYPRGSQISLAQGATAVTPIQSIDSPGQDNISNPATRLVRICIDDEFVTYVVFEDTSGNLISLGWMNWLFTAHAERDTGVCPPTSTATDCTGWTVAGFGSAVKSDFTPGTSGPQKLDRSVQTVDTLPDDCPDSSCAKQ